MYLRSPWYSAHRGRNSVVYAMIVIELVSCCNMLIVFNKVVLVKEPSIPLLVPLTHLVPSCYASTYKRSCCRLIIVAFIVESLPCVLLHCKMKHLLLCFMSRWLRNATCLRLSRKFAVSITCIITQFFVQFPKARKQYISLC